MTKRKRSTVPAQSRNLARGEGYVTVRQRLSGMRYEARWPNGVGYDSRTFATHAEAEAHIHAMALHHLSGGYVPPPDLTVEQLVSAWLDRGAHRWKPNTLNTFRNRASRYVMPALGELRALDLTTPRVQHWVDALSTSGYSPAFVASVVHILRATYLEAIRIGICSRSPVAGVQLPKRQRASVNPWTEAEMQRVLLSITEPMWQALYRLALTTGMRPGELRALRWRDIDRDAGTVTVRRTMTRSADGAIVVGDSTKTGRERIVTLTTSAADALIIWRKVQIEQRLRSRDWSEAEYIFTQERDGMPLAQVTWQTKHKAICRDAKVREIRLHDTRHTAATVLMARGVNPKVVSEMLGHQSVSTTLMIYSHTDMEMLRSAANQLEQAIERNTGS